MRAKGPGEDDSQGKTTQIQGELTPTAFGLALSAGKLNLPLVPSQDYVLQDNKRCYDKILSDWNFRLPLFGFKCIMVGLMNMIDGMQFWTPEMQLTVGPVGPRGAEF
jgi:hypothetical protein